MTKEDSEDCEIFQRNTIKYEYSAEIIEACFRKATQKIIDLVLGCRKWSKEVQ